VDLTQRTLRAQRRIRKAKLGARHGISPAFEFSKSRASQLLAKHSTLRARREARNANFEFRISSFDTSQLLLGGASFGGGVGVFLGEALDAAGSVHKLLFAGEERVAIRADFHAQHVAFDSRASLKRVAAGAVHSDGMIIGMNTGFHGVAFRRVRSARQTRKSRVNEDLIAERSDSSVTSKGVNTAASLGREQFSIIREESNFAKWDRFSLDLT
jgi:hypothetical protein